MSRTVPIGAAARQLGVAPHVLRHWNDVGVLTPARSASGHRHYDAELLARARLIQLCQRAGLTLAEIKALAGTEPQARRAQVEEHRRTLTDRIDRLRRAEQFLAHTLTCTHPMALQCPGCSQFATDPIDTIDPTG